MINALFGIKKNMTSTYDARGRRTAATVLEVAPNLVLGVKVKDSKDGYDAVQLGMGHKKSLKKPQQGLVKKAGFDSDVRWIREVKATEAGEKPGQQILVSAIFSPGDSVKVTGTSKGRGFQGGVKRYNFQGGPKTHGQSDRHRAPGSIGSGTTPGRVYKGKRMAGHYGSDTVSVKGLEVISVDKNNNLITIKGGIPGPIGGLIKITKLGRIKGYTPPPEEKPSEEEEQADSSVKTLESGESENQVREEAAASDNKGDENAS